MKTKHTKAWFINRIDQYLIRNMASDLFNEPIKIASKSHAIALYISQSEKNYTYNTIK